MRQSSEFEQKREETAYAGQKANLVTLTGISLWTLMGIGLFLILLALLVANNWRATPTLAPTHRVITSPIEQ
jgi:hypothetical protein